MGNAGLAPRVWRALERCAGALSLATIGWLLYATLAAQLAKAAELPAEVGAGTLFFQSESGADRALPLSTEVRMSVSGMVARVAVAQRFRNTGTERIEAVYALPLPDDAAVDRLVMRVGERVIEGEIREHEQAERVYAAARDSGRRASLVSQKTPNLFTTAVANIGPGEWIDVTIEYLQTARYDAGELSLRLPMTLTPRYGDAAEGSHGATAEVAASAPPGAPAPAHEAVVHVVLEPGMELAHVGSRHHDVRVERRGRRYVVEPAAPRLPMDRDFVLTWRPNVGSAPAVAALTETVGDTTYALLMILPPDATHAFAPQPRELIFVVDTSGSMSGASLEQAKAALANALGRLNGADRLNVFRFDSTTASLYRAPVPFTSASYGEALAYVSGFQADGGTEMAPAIRAALSQPASAGHLRQVVFLTDGGVANESELFGLIRQHLGDARLFTIGIGAAPNSYFMRKAAQFGRGTYTHIGDTAAVADAMQALFAKIERAALTDVLVDWPDALELYPHRVPDLYAGEPVVIVGSFPARSGTIDVELTGSAGGAPWSQRVALAPGESAGIAALWARRKIEFLLDSRVDGVDEPLIRKMVVDVALEHHLVSPYTSLVAVDKTPQPAAATAPARRQIANMAPAGAAYALMPQTGTSAALFRLLGLLSLAAALIALRCARYVP